MPVEPFESLRDAYDRASECFKPYGNEKYLKNLVLSVFGSYGQSLFVTFCVFVIGLTLFPSSGEEPRTSYSMETGNASELTGLATESASTLTALGEVSGIVFSLTVFGFLVSAASVSKVLLYQHITSPNTRLRDSLGDSLVVSAQFLISDVFLFSVLGAVSLLLKWTASSMVILPLVVVGFVFAACVLARTLIQGLVVPRAVSGEGFWSAARSEAQSLVGSPVQYAGYLTVGWIVSTIFRGVLTLLIIPVSLLLIPVAALAGDNVFLLAVLVAYIVLYSSYSMVSAVFLNAYNLSCAGALERKEDSENGEKDQ
jgi:hypothetical protein